MARDIAELGIPQHDSTEVVQAAELLREAFLLEDDVVEIATLSASGDGAPILFRGSPPVPRVAAGDSAIELVSLADRLRQAAEQTRGHVPRSARILQLQGLVLALRGLSLTPAVRAGAAELFRALDREAMSGRAIVEADAFTTILRDAADRLATAADAGGTAELPGLLAPLVQRLDLMRGTDGAEDVDIMPIEALAPESDGEAGVVPIESLLYEEAASGVPRLLPFERTFTTYFRLLNEATEALAGPVVPIAALAPEAPSDSVPIQSLLYRGRRALERADLVRRELDAALRVQQDLNSVETLIAELLDLVPLALDDER